MTAELVFSLLGLVTSRILFYHVPSMREQPAVMDAARVSIIIPARNEAKTLPGLLADLQQQTSKPLEIICVNDASTDATERIAREYGATVIQAAQRPSGWLGKPWACQCGAQAAKGEHLLFLDADVRFAPDALAVLLGQYGTGDAVVSVQPYHHIGKGYEQLALLFNMIQLGANGTALPRQAPVGLFGPLVLISQSAFKAVGGYACVRTSIAEDVALGILLKQAGNTLRLFAGYQRIRFRMYPDGLNALIQGWTKNFADGAAKTPLWLSLLVFLWVTGCIAAPLGFSAAVITARWMEALIFLILYGLWVMEMKRVGSKVGRFHPMTFLLYPISLVLFLWVFLRSGLKKVFKRPVQWKGRDIPWER